MSGRRIAISIALAVGVGAAIACGGNTVGSPGGTGASAACDAYFAGYLALLACDEGALPSSDQALVRARFEQLCEGELALPDSSLTVADFEACGAALANFPCGGSVPKACATPAGGRAPAASCLDGSQCQSGGCSAGSSATCGTCESSLAIGTPCGPETTGACALGSTCDYASTPPTCEATTYGAFGASCDLFAALCDAGLVCSRATRTCAPPGAAGAACAVTVDCTNGMACVDSVCAPSGIGAACASATSCPTSTYCDAVSRTCAAVAWVGAGGACGENAYCLVGTCPIPSGSTTGVCPAVIADGQPCPSDAASTCDIYAECVAGVCAIPGATTCN